MDYKNDERYWNIKLLNKWFAISSILFLLSIMWMFLDDNDDEFKVYQREFRKLESEIAKEQLKGELDNVVKTRVEYEEKYNKEKINYDISKNDLDSLNNLLEETDGVLYKANMDYLFYKAEVDEKKYLYETELVKAHSHHEKLNHNSKPKGSP